MGECVGVGVSGCGVYTMVYGPLLTISREAAMRGPAVSHDFQGCLFSEAGGPSVSCPVGRVLGPPRVGSVLLPPTPQPQWTLVRILKSLQRSLCREPVRRGRTHNMSIFLSGCQHSLRAGLEASVLLPHHSFIKACRALQSLRWKEKVAQSGLCVTLRQNGWRPRLVSPCWE